jgi:hypothetical protein
VGAGRRRTQEQEQEQGHKAEDEDEDADEDEEAQLGVPTGALRTREGIAAGRDRVLFYFLLFFFVSCFFPERWSAFYVFLERKIYIK